jgi:DNA-binding MarR family transcriptional regulator
MAKTRTKVVREGLSRSVTHLLNRSLQLALDFHAEAAAGASLTQRQFTVLSAVGAADGLTQNDLVRATGIDRSTLADLVSRLLVKGLLLRERSLTDARANTVHLSAAGRDALGAGAGAAAAADDRLLALLSPKKRDSLLKGLGVLAAAADAPARDRSRGLAPSSARPTSADKAGPKKGKKNKKVKDAKATRRAKAAGDDAAPEPQDAA